MKSEPEDALRMDTGAPSEQATSTARQIEHGDPVVRVRGVRKTFTQAGTTIEVLCGVDLTVQRGESIAICGESGSGKSTLLSLIAGLDRPTAGSVQVAGTALDRANQHELALFRATRMGIVFQQFHLLNHLTAWENVALPLDIAGRDSAPQLARQALEQVGLGPRSEFYPYQLSGGECQRVAIARAIVARPPILLADEPSGNLDAATGVKVADLLFDLVGASGMTLVLVTHSAELAARCARQVTLRFGRFGDNEAVDRVA